MEQIKLPKHSENQAPMAKYMQNHFQFAGVKAVERKLLERPLLKASKNWSLPELSAQVSQIYQLPEREYQYVAIDLAARNAKRLDQTAYLTFVQLAGQAQWWDSIDAWRSVFGAYIQKQDTLRSDGQWFLNQSDFWFRRIGITLQLGWREATDCHFLDEGISANMADQEFFIQKAIGWALRDYSKTDPEWVRQKLQQLPELSPLAIREASKYLPDN